jgi:hypothetical protein
VAEYEFRVTVEDLTTGDRQVMEFAPGDYVLIPFGPCYRDGVQVYPLKCRHVTTIGGYGPSLPARTVPPGEAATGHGR